MNTLLKTAVLSIATGLLLSCGCVGGGTCTEPAATPASSEGGVTTTTKGGQCDGNAMATAGKGDAAPTGNRDSATAAIATPKR